MNALPPKCAPGSHEWVYVQFSYGEWIECQKCAFGPENEAEFDRENEATA